MISDLVQADGIDVLDRMAQFTGRRHDLIVHNVANLTTPGFRPVDVSVDGFQAELDRAVSRRRNDHPGRRRGLQLKNTRDVYFERTGMRFDPRPKGETIMRHDQNDSDVVSTMRDLTENVLMFRQTTELLRNRFATLRTAIRERL